jgi:hypothetical protein
MKTTVATPLPTATSSPADRNRITNNDHVDLVDMSQLTELAWEFEDGGIAGRELAVRRVVHAARALGVSPTMVAVLADPAEPEVARLRAFGCVATALADAARDPHTYARLLATAV